MVIIPKFVAKVFVNFPTLFATKPETFTEALVAYTAPLIVLLKIGLTFVSTSAGLLVINCCSDTYSINLVPFSAPTSIVLPSDFAPTYIMLPRGPNLLVMSASDSCFLKAVYFSRNHSNAFSNFPSTSPTITIPTDEPACLSETLRFF